MKARLSPLAVLLAAACGGAVHPGDATPGADAGKGDGAGTGPSDAGLPTFPSDASLVGDGSCDNLECQIPVCSQIITSIHGRVLDPAGRHPVYDAVVFVPNTPGGALPALGAGLDATSCNCSSVFTGTRPIATAVTAVDGTFSLRNVPAGANIPVAIQLGKWRREIQVPFVSACRATDLGDVALPATVSGNPQASLPSIAVSTGGADALECLLARIGIAASEFTGDPDDKSLHVHVFQGAGGHAAVSPSSPSSPASLWDSDADLARYDLVLLSCEGAPTTAPDAQALADYASAGGRVYAEHFHSAFFAAQPQFANTAAWSAGSYAGSIDDAIATTLPSGPPFPTGIAMQAWLGDAGALTGGLLPVVSAQYDAVVSAGNVSAPWLVTGPGVLPASTQMFSWPMPLPDADAGIAACGRVLFSDLHQGSSLAAPVDYTTSTVVPDGCASGAALTPSEEALEFALLDLLACSQVPVKGPPPGPDE